VLKLIAGAVVALALLVYLHRPHGANAGKVASCLEHGGASISRSRLFEDFFATVVGGELPGKLQRKLHELDGHVYDVTIEADIGWLIDTKQAHQEGSVEAAAAAQGFDITAQGGGKVVMLWTAGPSHASRSALDRCLP
jgi:hypothetical protein